jgi:hypothetical protein
VAVIEARNDMKPLWETMNTTATTRKLVFVLISFTSCSCSERLVSNFAVPQTTKNGQSAKYGCNLQ